MTRCRSAGDDTSDGRRSRRRPRCSSTRACSRDALRALRQHLIRRGTPGISVQLLRDERQLRPGELRVLAAARQRIVDLEERVQQLQTALDSRIVIEQAKGVLAERLAISVDEAFEILRYAARSHREKLYDVARRVVEGGETPGPVIVAIAKEQRPRAAWMRDVAEAHRARVEELHIKLAEQVQRLRQTRGER